MAFSIRPTSARTSLRSGTFSADAVALLPGIGSTWGFSFMRTFLLVVADDELEDGFAEVDPEVPPLALVLRGRSR